MAAAVTWDDRRLEEARLDYEANGATILHNVIPSYWIDKLAEGTERLLQQNTGTEFSRPGAGRFFGDLFAYLRVPEYRDFIFQSGVAGLAGAIMQSEEVRFFYDQPLVKEPGTPTRTPWHHDTAYWPFSGEQVMSIWVPLDAATPTNGVVTYVKGSHKWRAFYPVENWSDNQSAAEVVPKQTQAENPGPGANPQQLRTIADIRDHPDNYEFCTWDVEPGDVLIHHKDTIHGAPGNNSPTQRRRAVAFRFLGDDARWDESRAQMFERLKGAKDFPYPDHKTGDRITAPLFPILQTSR